MFIIYNIFILRIHFTSPFKSTDLFLVSYLGGVRVINKVGLLLLVLISFFACKKEGNTDGPKVNWTSPTEGSLIFSVDTFPVIADVQSDDGISRISVKLTTPEGNSLASMGDVFPNGNSYSLNSTFLLNRPDLLNGAYYLKLEAYSENATTSVFRSIQLLPIPWEVRATAMAYGTGNNRSVAIREVGLWSDIFNNGGDVEQLLCNHIDGLLYVVSQQSGKVHALEYPGFNEKWQFEIPNNTSWRSIESASFNPELGELMVADTDQLVRVLNKSGSTILGFETGLALHLPVKSLLTSQRIYLVERRIDNSNQDFSVFFKSSGALDARVGLSGHVVDLFEQYSSESLAEHDEVVVFVNDNGTPRLRVFNRFSSGFTNPITLPEGTITAACKTGPRKYLFQIGGTIYQYNFMGPLSIYYTGEEFSKLVFDPVNNQVLGIRPEGVQVMGFGGSGLQDVDWWPQSDIRDVAVLRNR